MAGHRRLVFHCCRGSTYTDTPSGRAYRPTRHRHIEGPCPSQRARGNQQLRGFLLEPQIPAGRPDGPRRPVPVEQAPREGTGRLTRIPPLHTAVSFCVAICETRHPNLRSLRASAPDEVDQQRSLGPPGSEEPILDWRFRRRPQVRQRPFTARTTGTPCRLTGHRQTISTKVLRREGENALAASSIRSAPPNHLVSTGCRWHRPIAKVDRRMTRYSARSASCAQTERNHLSGCIFVPPPLQVEVFRAPAICHNHPSICEDRGCAPRLANRHLPDEVCTGAAGTYLVRC